MRTVAAPDDTRTTSDPQSGQDEVLAGFTRLPRAIMLALSDERDRWAQRLVAETAAAYHRGLAEGYDHGYDEGRAHEHDCWIAYHDPARTEARQLARSRSYTELEIARYAPSRWKGKIPPHLEADARRRWLAALPRRRDRKVAP